MPRNSLSLLDLIDLPEAQSQVVRYLIEEGAKSLEELTATFSETQNELESNLKSLNAEGFVSRTLEGLFQADMGKRHFRSLPDELWTAVFAGGRSYSKQEISIFRIAIPMLQFARARLSQFTDHGPGHVLRVKSFAVQLGYMFGLSNYEHYLLRAGAMFHDVGNVIDRTTHHIISQETVLKLQESQLLPVSEKEAEIIALLCRWHRKDYEPERIDHMDGETVRTGLMASILRIADAMDIDLRRNDQSEKFHWVIHFFYPNELYYWTGLDVIYGVRIYCRREEIGFEVVVEDDGKLDENFHIDMLKRDVASTPLELPVNLLRLADEVKAKETKTAKAILIFPFETYSIIMAALSYRNLEADGYEVEIFSYPDTSIGSYTLWSSTLLNELDTHSYKRIVILGDRPDGHIDDYIEQCIKQWREQDIEISLLNWHEANWSRLLKFMPYGIETILGTSWAYFYGEHVSHWHVFWGHIASVASRDPLQTTSFDYKTEQGISQGLLYAMFAVMEQVKTRKVNWSEEAKQVIKQILTDERDYFISQANAFRTSYLKSDVIAEQRGNILVYEKGDESIPPQVYRWLLEKQIEARGRKMTRGIEFKTSYAIALLHDEDKTELIAINHWLDESATPVRLLYPDDIAPAPSGNENAIFVRLPIEQAHAVMEAIIEACNQELKS